MTKRFRSHSKHSHQLRREAKTKIIEEKVVTKLTECRRKNHVKLSRCVKHHVVKKNMIPKSKTHMKKKCMQLPHCGCVLDVSKIILRFSIGDTVQVSIQQESKLVWMRGSFIDLWCKAPEPNGWAAHEVKLDFKSRSKKGTVFVGFDREHIIRSEIKKNDS